jgi:hypothetical protein
MGNPSFIPLSLLLTAIRIYLKQPEPPDFKPGSGDIFDPSVGRLLSSLFWRSVLRPPGHKRVHYFCINSQLEA